MRAQRKFISFIGLGSSGVSTALYSYIQNHSQVGLPKKETNFFSQTKVYSKGMEWYESLFPQDEIKTVRGELSNNYLANSQSAILIARTYPNAKLLAVVANPLLLVRIAYIEALRAREISPKTSLAAYIKQSPEVLSKGLQGAYLAQYYSYYATTDLLVLTNTEINEAPLAAIKKAYNHIGADPAFVPKSLTHLVVVDEDTVKKKGIIKRFFSAIKAMIKGAYLKVAYTISPPVLPEESLLSEAKRVKLSPELKAYLIKYYSEDAELLSRLLSENMLFKWGFVKDENT